MQPESPGKATAPHDQPPLFELEYTLDRDDWVDYYAYWLEKQPRRRFPLRLALVSLMTGTLVALPLIGVFVVLPLVAVGTKILQDREARLHLGGMAVLCLGIILVCGSIMFFQARSKREAGKARRLQAEKLVRQHILDGIIRLQLRKQVRMTEEGFVEVDEFRDNDGGVEVHGRTEFRVPWTAVEGVDVTERLALLIVGKKGFLMVPRQTFADEATFSGLLVTVASLRRRASQASTRPPVAGQEGEATSGITLKPRSHPDDRITR